MADDPGSSKLWTVFSVVSALVAAALAKKALDTGWKAATGKHPPENPADPDVAMGEAVAWAVVSGTFVALARMIAQRRAANYYANPQNPFSNTVSLNMLGIHSSVKSNINGLRPISFLKYLLRSARIFSCSRSESRSSSGALS